MKFKVTLSKPKSIKGNPFYPGLIHRKIAVELRTWEFEADNEEQVKEFYQEAVDKDLPNVRGFKLDSIELMDAE